MIESDQGLSLSDHSKKIKKPKGKSEFESPKNESDETPHFKPTNSKELIYGKYLIVKHIADGTFGRVFDAIDCNDQHYAIKIVKATKNCIENAKSEAKKLRELNSRKCIQGKNLIVQLIEHFDWKEHYCLVLEKLSLNLYQYLRIHKHQGYPDQMFKSVFRQMLQAVNLLHSMDLIHTDLKPENALFQKDPLKEPKDFSIKLIDFGNISHISEGNRNLITTRQYRAPEVIMGCCKWGKPSDVWSLGCIILEIYLGNLFFNTHNNFEHLALIEKIMGYIPMWMVKKAKPKIKTFFHIKEVKLCVDKLCIDKKSLNKKSKKKIKESNNLKKIFEQKNDFELYDLIKRILNVDPLKRLTCEEALSHNYFI